ncbi:MAG TPA: PH domain-containing protein, partial [Clostridiales bacterium]|nr:PH domain-containing protein [Clostridiales bacterium]
MFENRSRNHFTIIFERVGIIIFLPFLIGFGSVQNYLSRALRPEFWKDLGQNILSADRSLVSLGALIYVFLFALTLIAAVLYWLRTSFCVKEDLFIFERATFFKKTVKLPLANIATVNIERNLFERLVGTAKLKLDLNSAHTANKTDFVLVLPLDRAMALQAALTAFKKSDIIEEAQEAKLISNYSALSAARHKILSLPVFQIILGLFVLFSGKRDAGAGSDDLKNSLIFLLILSVGYGFSLIYSVLNLSDFKLLSDNKYFYISSGKLKKFHYTFARNKINALLLRQPTLARLFKLGSLEAAVVGLGNERSETPRLSLLAKREDLEIIVRDYFPDFDLWGPQKQSH